MLKILENSESSLILHPLSDTKAMQFEPQIFFEKVIFFFRHSETFFLLAT